MAVTITEGTQTGIKTTDSGGHIQHVRMDGGTLAIGSIIVTAGTVDTELPAAVALSDTLSNPTTPQIGANLLGWNTTTWERVRINIGDGAASTGMLNTVGMVYNGATYDRLRGNIGGGNATFPGYHTDAFATVVGLSGTVLGTVKAGVAGSSHYITDMLISANGAAVTCLYAGSTLIRSGTHYFGANGGLVNNLNTPIKIDAGSEITFRHIGTGLVTVEVRGYID